MNRRTVAKTLVALASGAAAGNALVAQEEHGGAGFRVRVLAFDGADEIDFSAPIEVFGAVAMSRPEVHVQLVTLQKQETVTGAHGLRVRPDGVLDEGPHLLFVPGGGWVNHSNRGVRAEIERGEIVAAIRRAHAAGAVVAGACTGAMAVVAAGLLNGRAATTHHGAFGDLRRTKARLVKARVVDVGDVVTCGGVTSTLDLALWMTERFWGKALADNIADYVEHPRSPDIHIEKS